MKGQRVASSAAPRGSSLRLLLLLLLSACGAPVVEPAFADADFGRPDPVRVEAEEAARRALGREAARVPRDTWDEDEDGAPTGQAVAVAPTHLDPLEQVRWLQGSASSGGVVVWVFWEPWCAECRLELPDLERLSDRLAGEVAVVGLTTLSRGGSATRALALLDAAGVDFPVGIVPPSLHERAGVAEIPHAVVTREGQVIWRGSPRALSPSRVRRLAR